MAEREEIKEDLISFLDEINRGTKNVRDAISELIKTEEGLTKRVRKLIEWTGKLDDDTYLYSKDLKMYLEGGFGEDNPEDEIPHILKSEN